MVKVIDFGRSYTTTIKNEKISGILLDIAAIKTDDTVGSIVDLNRIGLDLKLTRKGREAVYIHQGYLDDFLIALYGQTTRLEIAKTKLSTGYNMLLDFSGVLKLREGDVLDVVINADISAFGSILTSKSSITVETIPSTQDETLMPTVHVTSIGNGETNFDKLFPDNCVKMVLVTDYTAAYDNSTKAKVSSFQLSGLLDGLNGQRETYDKSVSENLLIAQNRNMFDNNPESDVQNLVIFLSENLLDEARLRLKLTKPADESAKVLTVHYDVM